MADSNEFGDYIVIESSEELYFCVVWTNANLDPWYLQVHVGKSGGSVIMKQAKPIPDDPSELLREYSWGDNSTHFVAREFNEEVRRMKRELLKSNKWNETPLIHLDSEVVGHFVNVYGNKTNDVQTDIDDA
eukprot:4278545-Ditylum_brightwellii.AAC.1